MKRTAFTLIEIMVVVVIIAVLSAMAVPSLMGSYQKAALRTETQQLLDAVRYAQRMAVVKNRTLRMVFVPDDPEHDGRSSYRLELAATDLDEPETYTKVNGGVIKPAVLPESLKLIDVRLDAGLPPGDQLFVRFFPDGSADAAVIQLGDDQRIRSIVIEAATGRIEAVPLRVDAAPNRREDLDA